MFVVKQVIKMTLQNLILPIIYCFWSVIYLRKKKHLIIFADGHHDSLPYSMKNMYDMIREKGYETVDVFKDYGKVSQVKTFLLAAGFMKLYAQAKYVFICDNFFPVVSCRKSKETRVVQLWHSCGLLKTMGYDTKDDIPKYYIGNVYKNYDLVTVSAPACVDYLTRAMRQPEGVVQPLGVSRTDTYFQKSWTEACKTRFYEQYPNALNKKIILWTPTFRGNAGKPYQVGTDEILKLEQELGGEYFVIRKVHPHIEAKYHLSNCSIPSEELLVVADLMITDYSSIVFDYLFFRKPYVLFAPDIEEYMEDRGFYIEYESLSPYVVTDGKNLAENVKDALEKSDKSWIEEQYHYHLSSCDGKATERILNYLELE